MLACLHVDAIRVTSASRVSEQTHVSEQLLPATLPLSQVPPVAPRVNQKQAFTRAQVHPGQKRKALPQPFSASANVDPPQRYFPQVNSTARQPHLGLVQQWSQKRPRLPTYVGALGNALLDASKSSEGKQLGEECWWPLSSVDARDETCAGDLVCARNGEDGRHFGCKGRHCCSEVVLTRDAFRRMVEDTKMDKIVLCGSEETDHVYNRLANGDVVSLEAFRDGLLDGPDRDLLQVLVDSWYKDKIQCQGSCSVSHLYEEELGSQELDDTTCLLSCDEVFDGYDWNTQTRDNHALGDVAEGQQEFVGEFKEIRATRDYSYHAHYSVARQHWQDAVIGRTVYSKSGDCPRPWLIYTAGGMGAGKGHVMKIMSKLGALARERLVVVNPDSFKAIMPEFDKYSKDNGAMTHQESAFMQEIAAEAAMERRSNLLEDGSLRDAGWYTGKGARTSEDPASADWMGVIPGIKKRYPYYRIAILHTKMDLPEADLKQYLQERLIGRQAQSGRETPIDRAYASVTGSAETVERIVDLGLADFVADFNNVDDTVITRVIIDGKEQDLGTIHADDRWDFIRDLFGADALKPPRRSSRQSKAESHHDSQVQKELEDFFVQMCLE